ncbi:MAG TPA: hypothetical protein VLM79_00520 [Kofleriaceae bacterium]|nr:hypothetical protein [Kofleriaceae bacterium]
MMQIKRTPAERLARNQGRVCGLSIALVACIGCAIDEQPDENSTAVVAESLTAATNVACDPAGTNAGDTAAANALNPVLTKDMHGLMTDPQPYHAICGDHWWHRRHIVTCHT